jgi:hypothetical protein
MKQKYFIDRYGNTYDKYGRVMEFADRILYTKKGKRRKVGNRTVAIKIK